MKSKTMIILVSILAIAIIAVSAVLLFHIVHFNQKTEVTEATSSPMLTEQPEVTVPLVQITETEEPVQLPMENAELRTALEDALTDVSSKWVVSCQTLDGLYKTVVCHNAEENEPLISASIIKIFIMAAVYDHIAQGEINEEDVYQTIYEMITVSDNEAANTLTRILGQGDAASGEAEVNRFARSIGCTSVSHNRLMLENNGTQNYVSAADCTRILQMIFNGECVSPEASLKMLEILKAQKDHDYIPSGVPENIEIAHKGGDLFGLCQGDVGIVFAQDSPYIICIICNDPNSFDGATQKITELSTLVYSLTACEKTE